MASAFRTFYTVNIGSKFAFDALHHMTLKEGIVAFNLTMSLRSDIESRVFVYLIV
jgi:hypothetical protein